MKRRFTRGGQLLLPVALTPCILGESGEALVVDARAGLTPAGMVDRKLLRMLPGAATADGRVRSDEAAIRGFSRDHLPDHPLS